MNVLQVIPYFHSSAGGPPVVVRNFARALAERDTPCSVLTTDWGFDSITEARIVATEFSENVFVTPYSKTGHFSSTIRKQIQEMLRNIDIAIVHTMWSPFNNQITRQLRLAETPYLVMPHGMLDPYSMERKRLKKLLYYYLIERNNLRTCEGLLYTTAIEQNLARKLIGDMPGHVFSLGIEQSMPAHISKANEGPLRLLFLGRLHEKKGIDILIQSVIQLKRAGNALQMEVVGDGDPSYVSMLRSLVPEGMRGDITFLGPLEGEQKLQAYRRADIFVLPSHQENFAIVVAEAMAAGLPVIVSDRVNTWPFVRDYDAGAVIPHAQLEQQLDTVIRQYLHATQDIQRQGENAQVCARTEFGISKMGSALMGALRCHV